MRTSKRFLALLLCVLALCTSLVIVHAVEERAPAYSCPWCMEGSITVSTSITNRQTIIVPCSHGTGGSDYYESYTEVTTYSCNRCSYSESSSEDFSDFLFCAGAGNR